MCDRAKKSASHSRHLGHQSHEILEKLIDFRFNVDKFSRELLLNFAIFEIFSSIFHEMRPDMSTMGSAFFSAAERPKHRGLRRPKSNPVIHINHCFLACVQWLSEIFVEKSTDSQGDSNVVSLLARSYVEGACSILCGLNLVHFRAKIANSVLPQRSQFGSFLVP